jgi:ribosome-associated translation inhibitor RaiA
MNVRIKVSDFEMNKNIEDYLDERVQAIEKHLGDDAAHSRCEIEIGRAAGHSNKGENWFAEFQILTPGEDLVRVVGHGETVNAAIDSAKDEILVTLKKDRTKRFSQTKKLGAKMKEWLRWGSN